jgi:hypothetical protein
LEFDGILYASAQVGAVPEIPEPSPGVILHELTDEELQQHNVVFFREAALVEQLIDGVGEKNDETGTIRESSLGIEPNSSKVVKVTGIDYSYNNLYIDIDDKPKDFMSELIDF